MGSNSFHSIEEIDHEVYQQLMEEGDANGDGEIDFEEFQDMMKKLVGGNKK